MKGVHIYNKITRRDNDSFKQYLQDISEIEMFTPEEEAECARKASNGDKKALDELIKRNLRFVVSVAKQYESPNHLLEDLVNEGNIGLILAAQKYNVTTGFKFISYAVFWIKKYILEYISKNGRLVRIPCNKVNNLNKYNNKVSQIEQKHCRDAQIFEIQDELGSIMSVEEIKELEIIANTKVQSLNDSINDEYSLYEMIIDKSFKQPDELAVSSDMKNKLVKLLNNLKPRDKKIMIMLFGLDGSVPLTLKEVGEEVGLTREMVRQIKEKSLKTLKKAYVG